MKTRYLKNLIIIGFLIIAALPLNADTDSASQPSVLMLNQDDAIKLALNNNGLIKAAERMVESARAEGKTRNAPFLPQLNTTYSYTRLDKAPSTTFDLGDGPTTIPMGVADNYEWAFQFVFPIYTGGAQPGVKKMIAVNNDMARNNLEIARRGISYGATEAYFGVQSTRHLVDVRTASFDYLKTAHDNALKMQQEGFFSTSEVLQIEVAKGRAEIDLRAAKDMEHSTTKSFKQLLALDPEMMIDISTQALPPEKVTLDRKQVIELAKANNGDLKNLELQYEMLQATKVVTQAGKRPSLSFVSTYSDKGDTFMLHPNGFGDPNTFTATLQIAWSIYDSGKVSQGVKQLEESLQAIEYQRNDATQKLEITIDSAISDYLRAIDNIEVAKRNLDSATENFRVLNERFKEGLEKSINLLEAETMLSGAKLQYNQSIYDSYRNIAKLAMESGFETSNQFLEALKIPMNNPQTPVLDTEKR